ncbi:MAG: aromatic-ring-hydroxylating dioxygenase subunit beta [Immundisolibacter sp.]|uniref:aromatic-ring-hydroxylating dioxygenase subunit beta n=1 Tax=Immundisolibacter sp. TaxID=1934948 RepID=UPI003D13AD40
MRDATAIATDLLHRECRYLDTRAWDAWLALYAPDAVYWVPAWRDEHTQTSDPDTEISQIFHDSRRGLEERVMRVRSGKSVTAQPLPRTTHFVSNVEARFDADGAIAAEASWMVQVYQPRSERQHANFGRYELRLAESAQGWVIVRKLIRLQNDCVPALVDFYLL